MFSNFKHNKMSSLHIKSDTIISISISICMHSKKQLRMKVRGNYIHVNLLADLTDPFIYKFFWYTLKV